MTTPTPITDDQMDKVLADYLNAIRRIKNNWLAHVEINRHEMKLAKLKYDCAIEAGFEHSTALWLATKRADI